MAKAPHSFDFYHSDFMAGTHHMTPAEVGGYIRMLCYQWANGHVPREYDRLQRITGIGGYEWCHGINRKSIEIICEKFVSSDETGDFIVNEKLKKQRDESMVNWLINRRNRGDKLSPEELSRIRSEAGKQGGRGRKKAKESKKANGEGGSRKKEVGSTSKETSKSRPDSIDTVNAYITEMGYKVNGEEWWDWQESVGWRAGKNPLKDWKASIRTWESRRKKECGKRKSQHEENMEVLKQWVNQEGDDDGDKGNRSEVLGSVVRNIQPKNNDGSGRSLFDGS